MENECGICGGPLFVLGTLGSLFWQQCRNCGMSWSQPVEQEPEPVATRPSNVSDFDDARR